MPNNLLVFPLLRKLYFKLSFITSIKLFGMRKIFPLTLLFVITGLSIYSQGNETMNNICTSSCSPASSSYGQRIWNGQNGSLWTATNSRTDQTINGNAITMNDDVSNTYVESGIILGGIGSLTITTQRKFTGTTSSIDVLINGVSIGTAPLGTDPITTTFAVVNIGGDVVIRVNNNIGGSNSGGQERVAIDDITWTGFVPLPVKWTSFTVEAKPNTNLLAWTTATEINNDRFDIERSSNGKNFKTIETVKGQGDSFKNVDYNYEDLSPISGSNYYRLKQVDFDGKYEYSDVIRADNIVSRINIYPTTSYDYITIDMDEQQVASVIVFNEVGQTIKDMTISEITTRIDISDLPNGMYFVQVNAQSGKEIKKIIKQ